MAAGLVLLLVSLTSDTIRQALITNYQILGATVLLLVAILLVPSRFALLAPLLAAGLFFGLGAINAVKVQAVGLPISYLDIVTAASNPLIPLHAIGYRGSLIIPVIAAVMLIGGVVALALKFGLPSRQRVGRRTLEAVPVVVLSLLALNVAGRDLRDRLPALYPDIQQQLWESGGQQTLAGSVGPLVYLAFTRLEGDAAAIGLAGKSAPPLPFADIDTARRQLLRFPTSALVQPNVVILHAESTFDPNLIFGLTEPVALPIWTARRETRSIGPLRVNVVGGGSWVTEFEVLTGVDSRSFGYQGFYTHQTIGPRARMALPRFFADRGYSTAAYYTEKAAFYGVAKAFRNYGVQNFRDSQALGLAPDWSDSDATVARKVIANGAFGPDTRPRFIFVSTQENHGPHACAHFTAASDFKVRFASGADFDQDCSLNEYLRRAASTSTAFEAILKELKRLESETGRPFVFLVYGDHQPWSFTDGEFSIAGGVADDAKIASFARFRKSDNGKVTFYHLLASRSDVSFTPANGTVPVTLLPTLVSAFALEDPADLYLPVNLLVYAQCGSDRGGAKCKFRTDADLWGREWLFQSRAPAQSGQVDRLGRQ